MLKLINIGSYDGTNKITPEVIVSRMVEAINNNSNVFVAGINMNQNFLFNILYKNSIIISSTGFYSNHSNNVLNAGYTIAIDDEKTFLIISCKLFAGFCRSSILNTQNGNPQINTSGIASGFSQGYPSNLMICSIAKDINENLFTIYGNPSIEYSQGISVFFDIGQHGTDEYTTDGDFILRQGAIRNHIVPELFFSMTRLGACGDIIEKDGHQYTCIAGPIFYQIS